MPRLTTSIQRRHRLADSITSLGSLAMRSCIECSRRGLTCMVHPSSQACEQCTRFSRGCDLSSPVPLIEKLSRQEGEILSEISQAHKTAREAEAKVARLRKQRRLLLKRMKELGDREAQNIFELECDEMVSGTGEGVVSSGALNSPSPRSSSFLDPALLDSQNRNPATPQGSS